MSRSGLVEGWRVALFGRVYEWSCVAGRWTLDPVDTDRRLQLLEELQRLLSGTGEIGGDEDPEQAIRACQERLRELEMEYE